ncbi:MAG: hypothetical protein E8G75_00115, partial [Sulfitobacter sp. SK025]
MQLARCAVTPGFARGRVDASMIGAVANDDLRDLRADVVAKALPWWWNRACDLLSAVQFVPSCHVGNPLNQTTVRGGYNGGVNRVVAVVGAV